jgi:hypothetical protein
MIRASEGLTMKKLKNSMRNLKKLKDGYLLLYMTD